MKEMRQALPTAVTAVTVNVCVQGAPEARAILPSMVNAHRKVKAKTAVPGPGSRLNK